MGAYQKGSAARGRRLREDMTDAERKLWSRLRNRQLLGQKFVRQLPVGPYVADFACREKDLIVEVDGGQHSGSVADRQRTEALATFGYSVLRFWNNDVLTNVDGVLQVIAETVAKAPSPGLRFVSLAEGPLTRSFGPTSPPEGEVSESTAEFPSSPLPLGERVRVRGPSAADESPATGDTP